MGDKRNKKRLKKRRIGNLKSDASSSNFENPPNKKHRTRHSLKTEAVIEKESTEVPVRDENLDQFGNTMRKIVFEPKTVEFKSTKVSRPQLRNIKSKLEGFNTKNKHRVVAIQGKKK